MSEAVLFGAGNIGRSFIGSILVRGGWKVTFIDADRNLVDLLNRRGGYRIKVKRNGREDEIIEIKGVSAVHSDDSRAVKEKLTSCSLCSTSVGQGALKYVAPVIAGAVKYRHETGLPSMDILIAENIRNGAGYFREIFKEHGLKGDEAGLVETSIGKMVPIMTTDDLAEDPLVLHAEEYNTLILDRKGFINGVPDLPEIKAVENVAAWVDRKLFIHNLGHAAAAYFGYKSYPDRLLIADVLQDEEIRSRTRGVMEESARALLAEYPSDFTGRDLEEHINDLLFRFENRALGDTVFRVGRDLYRKLNRNDRILGAAALCLKHGLPSCKIIDAFHAALSFRAGDPAGGKAPQDKLFIADMEDKGVLYLIDKKLGLGPEDSELKTKLTEAYL